jgi:polysaccharide biosynthesis protein PslG
MEINNLRLDPTDPGYVTNGLLVVELMSGRIQLGDAQFAPQRPPADIPVAGDANSIDALTYASLAPVASLNGDNRTPDRTGQDVTATLNRAGQVGDDPTRSGAVKIARYEPTLGHNIPDVFWTFMNASGPVYNGRFGTYSNGKVLDWVQALGYPITEPYWTNVQIGGVQKSVLVQAFQRRVLTFVADNPTGWQVEMGNVGRHYFDWRYGSLK